MAGSPGQFANLLIRTQQQRQAQRQQGELQKLRQLQEQKAQRPDATLQGHIRGVNQALVIMPYLEMANKKLLADQRKDPDFRMKYWKALNTYRQRPQSFWGTLSQQAFYQTSNDETERDLMRYFSLAGQTYSLALPGLIAGTGTRGGQFTMEQLNPHLPDYNLTPQQSWERIQNLKPRLLMDYRESAAHYKQFVQDDFKGAVSARNQWRSRFSNQEYRELAPGIMQDKDTVPPQALARYKGDELLGYYDLINGQLRPKQKPLPLVKAPFTGPPEAAHTLEIPPNAP